MFQTSFRNLPTIGDAEIGFGKGKGIWTFNNLRALNLASAAAPVAIKEFAARRAYYEKYNEYFALYGKGGGDQSWRNRSDLLKLQTEMEKQGKLFDSAIAAYNAEIEKDIMRKMTQAEITSLIRSITQEEKDRLTERDRLMKSMPYSRRNIERDIRRRKEENIIFLTRRIFRDLALAANEYKAAERAYIAELGKGTQKRDGTRSRLRAEEERRKKLFDSALAAYRAYIEKQFKSSISSIAKLRAEKERREKLLALAPTAKPIVKLAAAKPTEPLVTGAPVVEAITTSEPTAKPFNMKTLLIPGGIAAALLIATQMGKKEEKPTKEK
ncbi:MAG: hypothetical protein AB1349_11710 [Elusimicrobiota bacterium]